MVKAFNMTFGQDENDIEAWGRMCVLVDMEDIPVGLEARKLVSIRFPSSSLVRSVRPRIFDIYSSPLLESMRVHD